MAFVSLDFSALRETLRNRNFAIFTTGNGISLFGTWMQRLSVGWLIWHLTQSGSWLGAVSMAEFAPVVVLAPLFGVINDRFDRRRIAILGQYFAMAQAAALALLTLTDVITPMLILILQLCSGIIQPLIQTARLVLVPSMMPRERVGNAVAVTSLMFNCARIVGPMLAGLLIGAVGVGWAFAANALSYVAVIYALAILDLPPHVPKQGGKLMSGLSTELTAGWRYVMQHPLLSWVIPIIGIASMLVWPLGDMMPGIADHVFGRGPGGLAALMSAQAIGSIIGGLLLARRPSADGLARIVVGGMFVNGIMVAIFAMTSIFWLALPILVIANFFSVMVGVGSQSLAQTTVDDHMRGRALSVWYTVTRACPAIGALALGTLASKFGFGKPLFCAGMLSAITAAVTWHYKHRRRPQRVATS